MNHLAVNILDARSVLAGFGALGMFAVLFAETGLLIGFFLPGDSLLFTAGVLAASGAGAGIGVTLPAVLPASALGALLGAQVGFVIGRRGGTALLRRGRARALHRGGERARELLGRYGHGRAIVLARFVPGVRTVLNPLAGVVGVPAGVFLRWQVLGGLVWTVGLILAGYGLGSAVPNVERYLLPIVAVVVLVSLLPLVVESVRSWRARADSDQLSP